MSDRSFREARRHRSDRDFVPHRPHGRTPPPYNSAGRRQPVSGPPVQATVKWFNPEKGFGFVALGDGSGDAFLHSSVVEQSGRDASALKEGVTLRVTVGHGPKGPQVTDILELDESTTARPTSRGSVGPASRPVAPARGERMTGRVKWYSPERGFGFIAVDDGRSEVFVHATTLQRSRIASLSEGQRVIVEATDGRKGLEAVSITAD